MNKEVVTGSMDATILDESVDLLKFKELYKFSFDNSIRAVCVPPWAAEELDNVYGGYGRGVRICTVVDFPYGWMSPLGQFTVVKNHTDYTDDLDLVYNHKYMFADKLKVSKFITGYISRKNRVSKLIIETHKCQSDEDILKVVDFTAESGFDFVKTNTGFYGGAVLREVELIKDHIDKSGYKLKLKASGGIKTLSDYIRFLDAGADVIGTSAWREIVSELNT